MPLDDAALPSPLDTARAALAKAIEREAAVRLEASGAVTDATRELDAARQHRATLLQQRVRGAGEVKPAEMDAARAAVAAAELRVEAVNVEAAEMQSEAGAEVRHSRGVLLSLQRDVLRQRIAAVHAAANVAERRMVEWRNLYGNLSTAEAEAGRALRGGVGIAGAAEANIDGAMKRCDAILATLPAEMRSAS